jgi:hypothetical protein
MIIPIVKFVLYDNLACKKVYGGCYLSGGKRRTYQAGKTPKLPLSYLPIKSFNITLLLVILVFDDEPEIRSTNRKHDDEALAELVTTMFWVAPKNEKMERNSLPELSLEFGRESNFDEIVIAAYGYEPSWRRAIVA